MVSHADEASITTITSTAAVDCPGKKSKKEQPKKRQRGQKKPKKDKGDPQDSSHHTTVAISSKAVNSEIVESVLSQDITQEEDLPSLRPKKANKGRKRKDNYDPGDLGREITVPSAERLQQVTRGDNVTSKEVIARPQTKSDRGIREREISQLERRYRDTIKIQADRLAYTVPFTPSDPDFPFDLPELSLELVVPSGYPNQATTMKIVSGLEVGYARNIEREFAAERIGYGIAGRGLLGMLTWLDRNMERILAMKKSETIKIVKINSQTKPSTTSITAASAEPAKVDTLTHQPPPTYTSQQLSDAKIARNVELSKLRMIHPSRLDEDAFDLQVNENLLIRLQVPSLFPLESAWLIVLHGDDTIETKVNEELRINSRGLSRTINWIAANTHKLRISSNSPALNDPIDKTDTTSKSDKEQEKAYRQEEYRFKPVAGHTYSVPADPHAKVEEGYSSGDDYDYDSELEDDLQDLSLQENEESDRTMSADPASQTTTQLTTQEKGVAINSTMNLTNIALLEPCSISLTLKCLRCKAAGLPIDSLASSESRESRCLTCSSLLSMTFRGQAVHHPQSLRIGYLDLDGCLAITLGPASFIPTCLSCSERGTRFNGIVAGQAQSRPCRSCHANQIVHLTSTSFLNTNSSSTKLTSSTTTQRGKLRQNPFKPGQELPDRGTCQHYRKSNRWFRFPCCLQIYACDVCHDLLAGHLMEDLAKSQICGWCSKESPIRGSLKPCPHCGRELTRRSRATGGGGFWEGGQGVRDQSKMNRKDKRKYRKRLVGHAKPS